MKTATLVLMTFLLLGVQSPMLAAAQGHAAKTTMSATSHSAAMLKQDMRKLWTDHVVWTRDYIIAAVADQPFASHPMSSRGLTSLPCCR